MQQLDEVDQALREMGGGAADVVADEDLLAELDALADADTTTKLPDAPVTLPDVPVNETG